MESVWWVFKTLHEKNLVYRGFKVRLVKQTRVCRHCIVPSAHPICLVLDCVFPLVGYAVLDGLLDATVQLRGKLELQGGHP